MEVSSKQFMEQLEILIRRIVREELVRYAKEQSSVLYISSDSPLYEDLADISGRKLKEETHLYTHDEVWSE